MPPLQLRAALRRGFVLVVANWPIVLIDLTVSAFCRSALILPVAGGALMVSSLVGSDVGAHLVDGVLPAAEAVLEALATVPAALAAFLVSTALVTVGSDIVLLVVKGGTLSIVALADEHAGDLGRRVIGETELVTARVFSAERMIAGARRFARPMTVVAVVRAALYVGVVVVYLALVASAVASGSTGWPGAWSAVLLAATSVGIVAVSGINLASDLIRVAIVTDGCRLREAASRIWRFVILDARQVIGIVSVIAGIEIVASAVALFAAAGLTPVAYLPVVSLAVFPLQLAFWLLRSLLVEVASLASVAACQTQYRRFSTGRFPRQGLDLPQE